ncbi:MAG: BMP family ABC transporter substrate-binding protein [Oscillospiraceae bacterium]|nr:BMP family ABC transporter substrate-binding protein [Oscillospiraceae bacterium]
MKKLLAMLMAAAMTLSLVACGGSAGGAEDTAPQEGTAASEDGTYELALITDVGTIDDKSFNQGSWEGLKKFAEEAGISHKYYKPVEKSTDSYLASIELAVKGGAKLIVTPGFLYEEPIFIAQEQYPDVKFVLIDGTPNNGTEFKIADNTVSITYAEEQAGFLAGYAAVKEGYTKLGFMGGMAVPAVVRFGYGFVQGAEAAAAELGISEVQMNYHYTGGFSATPEAQTLAASWYQNGTEVIFACGGAVGNSVMAAAAQSNGKVIGVDVDQSSESETVITSAMKGIQASVYDVVKKYSEGQFPGGQALVFSAENNGVALPNETSKLTNFTQDDYNAVFNALASDENGIASSMIKDADKDGNPISLSDIPVSIVKLTEIK